MKKNRLIAVVLIGLAATFFVACSDGGGSSSGGSGTKETLVTKYSYTLNYKRTETDIYHRINEFHCVDNGDTTYNVKENIIHLFSVTNANYKDKTGAQLINMINLGDVPTPDAKETHTLSKETSSEAKNTAGEVIATYYMPAGLEYWTYLYK